MKCMQDYISKMEMSNLLITGNQLIYERNGKKEASVGVDSYSYSYSYSEDIEITQWLACLKHKRLKIENPHN